MPCSDLTVAVIHYQTPDLLGRCLARLLPAAPGARIVVIDAGDLAPLPPDWYSPGVELVRVANHSFAATVNAGLESCRTAYFAHMNADVLVERRTFTDLLGTLDADPAAGMAGPLPVDARGVLQDQGLPYRWWQWRAALDPSAWHHTTRRAGRSVRGVKAPWLSGCLQVVRTAAAHAAGPLDESQRFTNEETDWCHRMRDRGFGQVVLVGSVTSYFGLPSAAAYGATKAALNSMAQSLKYDFDKLNIRIQVVNPGFVDTPLTAKNKFDMPGLMPVDKASARFVDGIARGGFEIVFPRRLAWMLKAGTFLPQMLYHRIIRKATGWDQRRFGIKKKPK